MRSHPHALHATTSSDEAWDHVPNDYFHGILLIHSRLAIIHTDHNATAWEDLLTRQEETDAPHKISRINWKIYTWRRHMGYPEIYHSGQTTLVHR